MRRKLRTRNEIVPSEEKKPSHRWHTMQEYRDSIVDCGGYFTLVARALGVSVSAVSQKIKNNPELQDLVKEIVETSVREAEVKLLEAVREGCSWAIQFVLRTRGRKYGYNESMSIEADVNVNAQTGVIVVPGPPASQEEWLEKVRENYRKQKMLESKLLEGHDGEAEN